LDNIPESNSQIRITEKSGKDIPKRQAYIIFGVVSLGLLMSGIDSTIVAVALPTFLVDLRTTLALAGWTIAGYQFAQGVTMPIVGKLSDEFGRKKIFSAAVIIFTLSSMATGLAPNIFWLIVFRIIQGIGAGSFMPLATGIVSDVFGAHRATAIGLFVSIFSIGGVIGPNIGGFIIDNFSWRWIFFVNVPVGALVLALGAKILPRGDQPLSLSKRKLDVSGIGLFVAAILSILYAMTDWANSKSGSGILTWGLLALGVILFVVFIWHEDKTDQPMIETKLLRWRPFLAVNIYNFIFGAVVWGLVSFIPYYATVGYGMTAVQEGLLLTPRSLVIIIVSAVTSLFIERFRYRKPMIIGLLLISLSLFLLSRGYHDITIFGVGFHNLLLLSLIVAIAGIGMGISNPAANNAALDILPEKVAVVAGMRAMFRVIGGVMGTTAVTLILSYFPDKAAGLQYIYLGFAVLQLLLIPVVFLIPDAARDRKKSSTPLPAEGPPGLT